MKAKESIKESIKELKAAVEAMEEFDKAPGSNVAFLRLFPRSAVGKYQGDSLMRSMVCVKAGGGLELLSAIEVIKAISADWDLFGPDRFGSPGPRASDFFQAVLTRLKYLETYRPKAGDYAVDALQDAFVGLMYGKYDWGKIGTPTKGEVIEMAKAILKSQEKSKKSGWTELLRTAGLGWLPEGAAGRPSSFEVDRNLKDKQEFLSKLTQHVNEVLGGKWSRLNDKAGYVFGGKQLTQQHETERLKRYGRQEPSPNEEELE